MPEGSFSLYGAARLQRDVSVLVHSAVPNSRQNGYPWRMKKLTLATLLLAMTAFGSEVVTRGASVSKDAQAIPLAQVLESPDAYTKDAVVVEGVIETSCSRKGCWMQL